MSNETLRKLFHSLPDRPVPAGKIGTTVQKSPLFQHLLQAGIIEKQRQGRGFVFAVAQPETYQQFLRLNFPNEGEGFAEGSGFQNVLKYRDTKGQKRSAKNMVFFRGWADLIINGKTLNLTSYTEDYGVFSAQIQKIEAERLCFVENLEPFLAAEEIWPKNWVFFHAYGRVGKSILDCINTKELWVCVDYDYDGLEEFLRIKENLSQANIYLPDNLEALHEKFSKKLPKGAIAKSRTKESQEPKVKRIQALLEKTGQFLEQEALWYDLKSGSR